MVYDIGFCWLMNDEGHGMDRYLRWNRSGVMFLCASGDGRADTWRVNAM